MGDWPAIQNLSTTIGAIYDCALDPTRWPATLSALCDHLDFRASTLALQAMPSGRTLLNVSVGIEPADLQRMVAYGDEVISQWGGPEVLAALPLEEPLLLSRVNPASRESRYSREWALPLGLVDTMAIGLTRDRDSLGTLGFGRHQDAGPVGGLGVPARCKDGGELVLHVLPLTPTALLPAATAAIFVAPAAAPQPGPMDAIASLFDLTPAESRVLAEIAAGRSNAETAAALGIGLATVRTHLLRVFDKTRTHRQADLVSLVASFALPLA